MQEGINLVVPLIPESEMEENAARVINGHRGVAYAKKRPKLYLRTLSYCMVYYMYTEAYVY